MCILAWGSGRRESRRWYRGFLRAALYVNKMSTTSLSFYILGDAVLQMGLFEVSVLYMKNKLKTSDSTKGKWLVRQKNISKKKIYGL